MDPNLFVTKTQIDLELVCTEKILNQKMFGPKFLKTGYIYPTFFAPKRFEDPKYLQTQYIWTQNSLCIQNPLDQNFFGTKFWTFNLQGTKEFKRQSFLDL